MHARQICQCHPFISKRSDGRLTAPPGPASGNVRSRTQEFTEEKAAITSRYDLTIHTPGKRTNLFPVLFRRCAFSAYHESDTSRNSPSQCLSTPFPGPLFGDGDARLVVGAGPDRLRWRWAPLFGEARAHG